jgi:hypothetical protein
MAPPHEFFTEKSIGQLACAVAAVTVVSVAGRVITGVDNQIVALVASVIVTYCTAGTSGRLQAIPWRQFPTTTFFQAAFGWLLPLVNACLLFTIVVGATSIANLAPSKSTSHLAGFAASGRE